MLSHFRSHEALEDLEMPDKETVVAEDVGAAVGPDTATDKEAEKSDVTAEEALQSILSSSTYLYFCLAVP